MKKRDGLRALGMAGGVALLQLTGCSMATDATAGDDQAVVGVTDFAPLQQALKLVADKKVNGVWSRGDAVLKSGACYISVKGPGAKDPQNWEFRRYTRGAAFFKKLNSGPNTGDRRAIECLDIDLGGEDALSLDGFALDAVLRYNLGAAQETESGAGLTGILFERGMVTTSGPGKAGEPLPPVLKNTIDHPAVAGARLYNISPNAPANVVIEPQQAFLAYQYARVRAVAADTFDLSTDPVGRLVGQEIVPETGINVTRYEHVDIHRKVAGAKEQLFVTPKNSDTRVATSAIVTCTRAASSAAYACVGLQ